MPADPLANMPSWPTELSFYKQNSRQRGCALARTWAAAGLRAIDARVRQWTAKKPLAPVRRH